MSLTQFVGESNVRERLNDVFPNQGTSASESIKAEWQTNHYMLIGTAFDYLARFWLRRNVSEFNARPWIAETSLELAEERFPEYVTEVSSAIERAKAERDEYLESGALTNPLIECAIDLARIDGIYRSGEPPIDLNQYDDADIEDCHQLWEILNSSDALEGESVLLNPAFGLASLFVGGADADAILDGVLVDVKATGQSTFKADYWRQLVGYLVLADVHNSLRDMGIYDQIGVAEDPNYRRLPKVESFGVYFARHGELSTIPAGEVYRQDDYQAFRSWFIETALDKYEPFEDSIDETIRDLF